MTQDVQSDCRLFGNERQQETLARVTPGRPRRCSRHRCDMEGNSIETRSAHFPTLFRLSIASPGGS
ncbi:hypothetical protein [Paraburkholderia bryophila]|jgi:hypothetical protein|uniref:Uncharacterized protein n=1 Tax=Paraburkholderia bryophila TaxID=420952 RepID=A0A7Z0B3F8_9BURK|nr:hypothetical protein [Paraburkholderia bryophila]NYH20076.1 hypothetical protein [Paraburkholderia bryophila]